MNYIENNPLFGLCVESRSILELGELFASKVYRGEVPHGDGQPIMVIPGAGGSDLQIGLMRDWLIKIGYVVCPSGIVLNIGEAEKNAKIVEAELSRNFAKLQKKMTLIGYSAGGMLAMDIASRRPEMIGEILLLGTPLHNDLSNQIVWYGQLVRGNNLLDSSVGRRTPSDVPNGIKMTSIYGRYDQLIPDKRNFYHPRVNTIAVNGSHLGLCHNVQVFKNIAYTLGGGRA